MSDLIYQKLVRRWQEVTDLPTQRFGPLTPLYKAFTKRLKVMPWPMFILIGIVFVGIIYWVFGSAVTFIVSLLQRGF